MDYRDGTLNDAQNTHSLPTIQRDVRALMTKLTRLRTMETTDQRHSRSTGGTSDIPQRALHSIIMAAGGTDGGRTARPAHDYDMA